MRAHGSQPSLIPQVPPVEQDPPPVLPLDALAPVLVAKVESFL